MARGQQTSGGTGSSSGQVRGDFGGPRPGTTPTPATTPTTTADTPATAPTGEGFNITPAVAIGLGTAAAGLIQGIMAQRNAAKNRRFTEEQNELAREEARKARQQAAVQNAIGNVGNQAAVGAQQQGSALSGLASLFGGL